MEGIHSAGGGGSMDFSSFPRDYHYDRDQLPAPPAAYEDFDFTSPFDFDLFPSSTQSASTFLANPFGTTDSTFSPPSYPTVTSPSPQHTSQQFAAAHSNKWNAGDSRSVETMTQSPPQRINSTSAAATSFPNPPNFQNTSSQPLFNDSESALLSGFLTGLDVDPNFIFNPILPPGMPSPPSGTYPPKREDQLEREALGDEVRGLELGGSAADEGRWYDEDDEDRKPEIDFDAEGEFEQEETANDSQADPDFPHKSSRGGTRISTSSATRRGKTRVAMGSQGGTKGKKPKLNELQTGENSALHENETGGDVEMDQLNSSHASKSGRPNRIIKKTSRALSNSSSGTQTRTKPSAKPSPPPRAAHDSPEAEADTSLSQSRGPLTETEKRSNHIQSEQRRRNAIRLGFQDLVDLLSAGEQASGIVVAPPEQADDPSGNAQTAGKGKKKGKGNGRGRGRKGEVATGGSKSVVLEKAAMYILWLERGNKGLEAEVERVEGLLKEMQT